MRQRLYEIIEKSRDGDKLSYFYDVFMIVVIVISLIPLAFKEDNQVFYYMDKTAMVIFMIDYVLRWSTADYKFEQHSPMAFAKYPFTAMAIIDLVSILPSVSVISRGFKVLRVMRMIRALRVLTISCAYRLTTSSGPQRTLWSR